MGLDERGTLVVEGSWLYGHTIRCRIAIVRRDHRCGTGDHEDPPEIADDQSVETFEVLYASPTDPDRLGAGGGQFATLDAARAAVEATCGPTVIWEPIAMGPTEHLQEVAIPLLDRAYSTGLASLSRAEKVVYLVWCFVADVDNGGSPAFICNSSGENADETVAALRAVGWGDVADKLVGILGLFPGSVVPADIHDRNRAWDSLPERQRDTVSRPWTRRTWSSGPKSSSGERGSTGCERVATEPDAKPRRPPRRRASALADSPFSANHHPRPPAA